MSLREARRKIDASLSRGLSQPESGIEAARRAAFGGTDPSYDTLGIGLELYPSRPEKFGTSFESDPRRAARERGSTTLTRRLHAEFRARGLSEEFERYRELGGNYPLGSETLAAADQALESGALPAIFDLLQIGQFAATGGVDELLRTGSVWEATKQAAIELASALPGIEVEGARKLSFGETDLPRILFGEDSTSLRCATECDFTT